MRHPLARARVRHILLASVTTLAFGGLFWGCLLSPSELSTTCTTKGLEFGSGNCSSTPTTVAPSAPTTPNNITFQNAFRMGSNVLEDTGQCAHSMALTSSGELFVACSLNAGFDLDPTAAASSVNGDGQDAWVAKYRADNTVQWSHPIVSVGGQAQNQTLAIDSSDNVIIAGNIGATTDFQPGAGVTNKVLIGGEDCYIAKYTTAGALTWVNTFGGAGAACSVTRVTIDSNDNIIAAGYYAGNSIDADPGAGTTTLTSTATMNLFIARFTSSGALDWVKKLEHNSFTFRFYTAATDSLDNVYLGGYFFTAMDFDPGAGNTTLTPASSNDGFVLKLDSSGNFVWVQQYGSTGVTDAVMRIVITPTDELFVAGTFSATVDFDHGPGTANKVNTNAVAGDAFLAKYTTANVLDWVHTASSTNNDGFNSLAIDSTGRILLGGSFRNTLVFDDAATTSITSLGATDPILVEYESDGTLIKIGRGDTVGSGTIAAIATNGSSFAVFGEFSASTILDAFTSNPAASVVVSGASDFFISRYTR